jgi:hypothetical protein
MGMDLVHNVKVLQDVLPGSAVTTFAAGAAIDTAGYESLTFGMVVGAMAFTSSNKLVWTVEESDSSGSGYAPVATGDYIESYREGVSGWDRAMDLQADDENHVFTIGVRMNTKRYKKLVPTETGTVSVVMATWAMLGHARHQPV